MRSRFDNEVPVAVALYSTLIPLFGATCEAQVDAPRDRTLRAIARRIAANSGMRTIACDRGEGLFVRVAGGDYFKVGDEIVFGKYKNKRGRIVQFFLDDRAVPMVEIEPLPKGRKKNRLMGLYNFWHVPERRLRNVPSKEPSIKPGLAVEAVVRVARLWQVSRRVARARARYQNKKVIENKDGEERSIYTYGPRQVGNRNKQKAERIEKLRKSIAALRKKVRADLSAKDANRRAVALAVALMDETYERPGNEGSAEDGHFGVTTWQPRHVTFGSNQATIRYVGKSGVRQEKIVKTPSVLKALRAACKDKDGKTSVVDVGAADVNEYLRDFDVTAKDLRGFHANEMMKERLRSVRSEGPELPRLRRERKPLLRKEFQQALRETAKDVGHEATTLRTQYLVPGLEVDYMKDGTVEDAHTKKSSSVVRRVATKSKAEREDEKVEKMLRPAPKCKPPRYDLRDNRTLSEEDEDPDLEGLGGGDKGDRDLSMKWNKVARRVAFRWFVVPVRPSITRILLAKEELPGWDDFKRSVEHQTFRHPDTDRDVQLGSLPWKEQKTEYEKWRSRNKPKEEPERERTIEEVEEELEKAQGDLDKLEEDLDEAKKTLAAESKEVKKLEKEYEKADGTYAEAVKNDLKKQRKKQRAAQAQVNSIRKEMKKAEKVLDDLKEEAEDPEGTKARKKQKRKRESEARASAAIKDTEDALRSLTGEDSELPEDVQKHIRERVADLDDQQTRDFSLAFQARLHDLIGEDPTSPAVIALANQVVRLKDVKKLEPEDAADRLAEMTFAQNVIANPNVVGGKEVGGREVTDLVYGERAKDAFEQFKGLHGKLRERAAEQIEKQLRDLDPEDDVAQELQAILTGINVAQVADTGKALPGRPEVSAGNAALVKHLVESGGAEKMFLPTEDFFKEGTRKVMSRALHEMGDDEVADFIVGESGDHPFAALRDAMKASGGGEYKQLLKSFLINDFLNDTWGDRAARDIMQAAGDDKAGDPQARAAVMLEAKEGMSGMLGEALAAMERAEEAKVQGQVPAEEDSNTIGAAFSGEKARALVDGARSLLKTLGSRFKTRVNTPAVAVLRHFVETGDPSVLTQETDPHPDDGQRSARRGPGDVWKTLKGWRAKSKEGISKTFKHLEDARAHAGVRQMSRRARREGLLSIPVEDRGPTM